MSITQKKRPTLEEELNLLLDELCAKQGFCSQLRAAELLADNDQVDADLFAREVLKAEGMDHEYDLKWLRNLRNIFIERYGSSRISASEFESRKL